MEAEDKDKKAIEIATAFSDGYQFGKYRAVEDILSWLLSHAASYSGNPKDYDPLSLVIDLRDFLNNKGKEGG